MKKIIKRKKRSDKFIFSEIDVKKIEKMASLGLSINQISAIFEISTDTFYRRCKEVDCDLSAAVTRGKAKAICNVAQKAYDLAIQGDTSMIKYYLSSIGGWSEKTQINNETEPPKQGFTVNIQDVLDSLSDEEIEAIRNLSCDKGKIANTTTVNQIEYSG